MLKDNPSWNWDSAFGRFLAWLESWFTADGLKINEISRADPGIPTKPTRDGRASLSDDLADQRYWFNNAGMHTPVNVNELIGGISEAARKVQYNPVPVGQEFRVIPSIDDSARWWLDERPKRRNWDNWAVFDLAQGVDNINRFPFFKSRPWLEFLEHRPR